MSSIEAAAAALAGAAKAIRALSRVPSQASVDASHSIEQLIDQQFARGVDPYGKPWKPNKPATVKRKGHARPNVDTENLWNGAKVAPMSGAGISVTFEQRYAAFVQNVRPIVPNRGVPKAWAMAIGQATAKAKAKALAGSGADMSGDAAAEVAQWVGNAAE
jgi:hypothetical protein